MGVRSTTADHSAALTGGAEAYEATAAGLGYRERRRRSVRPRKLVEGCRLWQAVYDRLYFLDWSPEQVSVLHTTSKEHANVKPRKT